MPHLQQAWQLHRKIGGLGQERHEAAEALEHLAIGIALVDDRGRILFVNRAAADILAQDDGLSIRNRSLCAALARETARTHVKRILAKTGAARQSDLIRLLLSGPAGLRVDEGGSLVQRARSRGRAFVRLGPTPLSSGASGRGFQQSAWTELVAWPALPSGRSCCCPRAPRPRPA